MEILALKSACGVIDLTVHTLPVITWTVHLFRSDWIKACSLEGYLSIFAQSCKCSNTWLRSVSFLLELPDRLETILKIMIITITQQWSRDFQYFPLLIHPSLKILQMNIDQAKQINSADKLATCQYYWPWTEWGSSSTRDGGMTAWVCRRRGHLSLLQSKKTL